MPSRRTVLASAVGLGVAGGFGYLYGANHTLPPADAAAEQRFRDLQSRALASYGLSAFSKQVPIAEPPLDVHVLEVGRGEPVLFLHGGNSVAAGWIPLLAKLEGYHAFAPDRPGCGLTTKFDYTNVSLREHAAAFVRSTMDALGLERAAVVGNSMGGYFALVFALAEPRRVSKLVLIGEPAGSAAEIRVANRLVGTRVVNSALFLSVLRPGEGTMRNSLRNMLVAHAERVPDDLVECLTAGSMIPGAAESWITLNETLFRPRGLGLLSGASTLSHALRPELSRLRAPTLLIWGERDTFGPPALGEEMAALMPEGRCEVIPDAGHLPWLDDADVVARHVRAFLG